MNKKQINLGIIGFGCVGKGVYDVLQRTPSIGIDIKKICVKSRDKDRLVDISLITYQVEDIINDPEINVVAELIDDSEAAFTIVKRCLQAGKSVVSANKKMIAEHFEELVALQQQHKTSLLYEAACCASIPIIRSLEDYYHSDLLQSVEGIVNGSTNYILSQIFSDHSSYEHSLKEAQDLGYAESNPIMDTGGFDATFKLLILLAHAFGVVVKPEDIVHIGIDELDPILVRYARAKGYKIKLIASAWRSIDGSYHAFVAPRFIAPHERLFDVDGVFNGITTTSQLNNSQFFVGEGAGAEPTATAVLSDILALRNGYSYHYRKLQKPEGIALNTDNLIKILLSYSKQKGSPQALLKNISESFEDEEGGYVIGHVSVKTLQALKKEWSGGIGVF